ncbi:3'-phosphoadenosine 5'-phosphosulfate sulfotransferase (PAPS reductase)/FAD synthetase [Anaerotaenia torta]|uniref:phosphoadenosine phosphosulfate reductase family protein n=1 Tax=Anaerotaenia torta TaxID=433293 RepID=UPI003D1AC31F
MELWQLRQFQALPFEIKAEKSKLRIREWYDHFEGNVFVSCSGGKDSTALLHLVRSMYPEVPAVFVDTGLEFPEIREFVKTLPNVEWLKPDISFRQVIEKHGYPVIGKEQSEWIHRIRVGDPNVFRAKFHGVMPDGRPTQYKLAEQWRFLLDAPFKIGGGCCNEMKKKPLGRYAKASGRFSYIGTMASESHLRIQQWLKTGCNAFDAKRPTSMPLSFWLESDVWEYLRRYEVPYSKIYDMGYERTGCIFCAFGAHLDTQPTRFQRLQKTHPKLWRYCMRDWEAGGLGLRQVLEYIGVPYEAFTLGE